MSQRRREVDGASERVRDEGSSLILALVVVMIGTLMVLPIMNYTMGVLRANRVTSGRSVRVEAVKGGLRAAMYDTLKLYQACQGAGATSGHDLWVPPGLGIETKCYMVGTAMQDVPSEQRYALATTQVGSGAVIPLPYVAEPERPELNGTMSPTWCSSMVQTDPGLKVPCGKPYPANGDTDAHHWVGDIDRTSGPGIVFMPYLPAVANVAAYANGYQMVDGGCTVFFPGRYIDNLEITGSQPVYFVSGIYYFEKSVHISGDATVVVGAGSVPGCADSDAVALGDAINAPFDAYSNGVGGTWVFGADGRLVIDNTVASTGNGVNLSFNRRLVAATDPEAVMNEVSIMSVNGVISGTNTVDLDIPGQLFVPESQVFGSTDTNPIDPLDHHYHASNLVSTVVAPAPCAVVQPPSVPSPGCPIIDINLTTAAKVKIKIPGYVTIPQGSMSVNVAPGANVDKNISFGGGILTGQMSVPAGVPDFLQLGLLNPVVQKTFKIVTNTVSGSGPQVNSVALVQVNETGGYAVNSWVVQAGPA
ncbi:MAG: hypothetical protein WCC60_23790 [Ilumatobacteraceae bacterium]